MWVETANQKELGPSRCLEMSYVQLVSIYCEKRQTLRPWQTDSEHVMWPMLSRPVTTIAAPCVPISGPLFVGSIRTMDNAPVRLAHRNTLVVLGSRRLSGTTVVRKVRR